MINRLNQDSKRLTLLATGSNLLYKMQAAEAWPEAFLSSVDASFLWQCLDHI